MVLFRSDFRPYLIMFFLLGVSGIPYFSSNQSFTILYSVALAILFLFSKKQKFDNELFYIFLGALGCILFQALIFSYFKLITILGLILKILTAYFAIKLLNENFIKYFLHVMIFFSIVSLIIFIPIFIDPPLLDAIINITPSFLSYKYQLWGFLVDNKTLIIYNLSKEVGRLRNCGPFWEPGAYGGFLILALTFNTIRQNSLINKINCLFLLVIISTQSTTAYLALFVFVAGYLLFQNHSKSAKFLVILVSIGGIIAFQTIPFLGEKIKVENEDTQDAIETKGGDARIASAVLDWNDVKGYPFTGRGLWPETRVDKKFEYVIRNNGLTNFLAEWGFLFFVFYFFYYYKGLNFYCKLNNANIFMPFLLLGIVLLISFSEDYFDLQFFWALVFLQIPLRKCYNYLELKLPIKER
jgi:hypothetical protein